MPLLQYSVTAACAVDELERVVVVLGADAEPIISALDFGRAEALICPNWSDGMSASLKHGAAALSPMQRIVVLLGDTPSVTPAVIRRFLSAPGGTRAAYSGTPGHPVVLGREQLAQLSRIRGDSGARELLTGAPMIECSDLASGVDIDTRFDLQRAKRR